MRLSLVIPVYNGEKHIKFLYDNLFSLYESLSHCLEMVLVNDGSTDRTLTLIEDLGFSKFAKVISFEENQGVSCARNVGIENAIGDYVSFMDADDVIDPLYLLEAINSIDDADIIMFPFTCRSNHLYQNLYSSVALDKDHAYKLFVNQIIKNSACSKFFQRRFLLNNNIRFIPGHRIGEDGFFTALSIIKSSTIRFEPIIFYDYLIGSEGSATLSVVSSDDLNILWESLYLLLNNESQSVQRLSHLNVFFQLYPYFSVMTSEQREEYSENFNCSRFKDIIGMKNKIKYLVYFFFKRPLRV